MYIYLIRQEIERESFFCMCLLRFFFNSEYLCISVLGIASQHSTTTTRKKNGKERKEEGKKHILVDGAALEVCGIFVRGTHKQTYSTTRTTFRSMEYFIHNVDVVLIGLLRICAPRVSRLCCSDAPLSAVREINYVQNSKPKLLVLKRPTLKATNINA